MAFLAALGGIGAGAGATAGGLGTTASVGIGLGTAGLLGQGISQYQTAQYNARIYGQQAENLQRVQLYNEQIQERQFQQMQSRNRLRTAMAGIEFSGTPLDIEISNRYNFQMDLINQRYNTEVQRAQLKSQAALSRYTGSSALFGSILGAGASAFTSSVLLGEK